MSSLVAEVLGTVTNATGRHITWFERLPADAQAELDAVRQSFDPAVHQKRAFALALIAAAEKRGWKIAREKQVIVWLEER